MFTTTNMKQKGKVVCQVEQKCDVFKIAQRMVKVNQDIVDEQCIKNDHGVRAVSDEDNKAWKIIELQKAIMRSF